MFRQPNEEIEGLHYEQHAQFLMLAHHHGMLEAHGIVIAHIMKMLVGIDKQDLLDVLETLKGAGPRGPFPDPPAYQEAYHHGYAEAFSSLLEILNQDVGVKFQRNPGS